MKKALPLVCISLLALSFTSSAQEAPNVKLGSIEMNPEINGQVKAVKTTRAELLTNTKLTTDLPYCKVTRFTCIMFGKGENWGPVIVKGSQLTPEIINHIKQWKPGSKVQLVLEEIKASCSGEEVKAKGIALQCEQ